MHFYALRCTSKCRGSRRDTCAFKVARVEVIVFWVGKDDGTHACQWLFCWAVYCLFGEASQPPTPPHPLPTPSPILKGLRLIIELVTTRSYVTQSVHTQVARGQCHAYPQALLFKKKIMMSLIHHRWHLNMWPTCTVCQVHLLLFALF